MKFELYDKVAFKTYKKTDYASSICGSIIAIKDDNIFFMPEKAEFGITKEKLKNFKK